MSTYVNDNEKNIREMRDEVYGKCISDKEWEHCKSRWMMPSEIRWLKDCCANN